VQGGAQDQDPGDGGDPGLGVAQRLGKPGPQGERRGVDAVGLGAEVDALLLGQGLDLLCGEGLGEGQAVPGQSGQARCIGSAAGAYNTPPSSRRPQSPQTRYSSFISRPMKHRGWKGSGPPAPSGHPASSHPHQPRSRMEAETWTMAAPSLPCPQRDLVGRDQRPGPLPRRRPGPLRTTATAATAGPGGPGAPGSPGQVGQRRRHRQDRQEGLPVHFQPHTRRLPIW
jgi:hypothetical protein